MRVLREDAAGARKMTSSTRRRFYPRRIDDDDTISPAFECGVEEGTSLGVDGGQVARAIMLSEPQLIARAGRRLN
jgi:hypothetical protein